MIPQTSSIPSPRRFGTTANIEIAADGQITLAESHAIAEQVHTAIEAQFLKVKHIMVYVNPAKPALGTNAEGEPQIQQ